MTRTTPNTWPASDQALHEALLALRHTEWASTLDILSHLAEAERRKLYVPRGHASLWQYCRRDLGYCETSALRRLAAVRCLEAHPPVLELLRAGELTLSTLSLVPRKLAAEEVARAIDLIRGRSRREAEKILVASGLVERPAVADRVRIVAERPRPAALPILELADEETPEPAGPASAAEPDPAAAQADVVPPPATHGQAVGTAEPQEPTRPAAPAAAGPAAGRAVRVQVSCTLSEAVWADYQKASALLSHVLGPAPRIEAVLGRLVHEFLERRDPEQRQARRERRAARAAARQAVSHASGPPEDPGAGIVVSRDVPDELRDRVWVRDGSQCTFVGPAGRCGATRGLTLEHLRPFALGGEHSEENLTLRCQAHNLGEAERIFGRDCMAKWRRRGGNGLTAAAAVERRPSVTEEAYAPDS